jgi:hypothetical protein
MFKHNIKYTDFNGTERDEDFYFHLSLPEVARIEARVGTSIKHHTENLISQGNNKDLLDFLEETILTSYGKKSNDGKSFMKSPELRREFEYSQAYANMFEQMLLDKEWAAKFGEGVADNGKAKKNTVAPKVVQD